MRKRAGKSLQESPEPENPESEGPRENVARDQSPPAIEALESQSGTTDEPFDADKGTARKPPARKRASSPRPGRPGVADPSALRTPQAAPPTGPRITGCILARNEATRIEDALRSLAGWTDEIIVLDNESEDETAEIARRHGAIVLTVSRAQTGANFDAIRNRAIEAASGDWIFYLDADERVPPALGSILRRAVAEQGDSFEAMLIPFRHYFCGQWMRYCNWWPGYTRPQLLKKGRFTYGDRLHTGVNVDGRTVTFPPDDPSLAIVHFSYDSLSHYMGKLNRYTDGEAENLLAEGASHEWTAQIAAFVHDWRVYYDHGEGHKDGMHGFTLSFLSAFYRFASRAKLWDLRRQQGSVSEGTPLPGSVREIIHFMLAVSREGADRWLHGAGQRPVIPDAWFRDNKSPEGYPLELFADRAPADSKPPLPARITGVILARNEEKRIERALRSLGGWCHQIIVVDNESDDATVEIARRYTDVVLTAPRAEYSDNFEPARNLALEHVTGDWVFFLDADERVGARLAETLLHLAATRASQFDALTIPSRNIVCGKWLRCPAWWPGYKNPYLVKMGTFRYAERLHGGIVVNGRTLALPADDPELSVLHESVSDVAFFVEKLNNYTDAESRNMLADGLGSEGWQAHGWQAQIATFTKDWTTHYDQLRAHEDGMQGFVFAFFCAFYRFLSRSKLWDQRRQAGTLDEIGAVMAEDPLHNQGPLPTSIAQIMEFMLRVLDEGEAPHLHTRRTAANTPLIANLDRLAPLVWAAPLHDPSGYADEARNFVLGLIEAGEPIFLSPMNWSDESAHITPEVAAAFAERSVSWHTPTSIYISQTTPPLHQPSPNALVNVARTMFETDRLQPGWERTLNRMDRIWVPSAFNKETFTRSGVDPEKIAIIPGALDTERFLAENEPDTETSWSVPGSEAFRFLAVFDWSLHKGWDVLLEAFAREFGRTAGDADASAPATAPSVGLVIKTWSSLTYTLDDIRAQASRCLVERVGRPLEDFVNIHLWQESIPAEQMPRLYRAVQAYVAPTRGEGWGRPLMEAMASGLPTIATAWSGLTEFHDDAVGYALKYEVVPIPDEGAREIPIYAGHQWAEPDVRHLGALMRQVVRQQKAAARRGKLGQARIRERYSRAAVAKIVREELAVCRRLATEKANALREAARGASPDGGADAPLRQRGRWIAPGPPGTRLLPALLRPPANPLPVDPMPRGDEGDFIARLGRPLRLRWEGDQTILSSLARVNREICLGLATPFGENERDVELSLRQSWTRGREESADPADAAALRDCSLSSPVWSRVVAEEGEARLAPIVDGLRRERSERGDGGAPPDVTIRHFWPPDWSPLRGNEGAAGDASRSTGKLVVMQPWELSHLPRPDWIEAATRHVDEVWAYSRFVRDIYVRSGVPVEKVHVVPLGVRTDVFRPDGPTLPLPELAEHAIRASGGAVAPLASIPRTRFLFVGGVIERKGADLVLEAFCRAFTPADDVCLIVKGLGARTFYRGASMDDDFRKAMTDPALPRVIYFDDDLGEQELAALYRSCTCLVAPYRGEGFALAPLEAMACGLPVIVTAGGASDDYVDDKCAFRLPCRQRVLVGHYDREPDQVKVDPYDLEPDLDGLVVALRQVHENPEETSARGLDALARVRSGWSWERTAAIARERIASLVGIATGSEDSERAATPTPWQPEEPREAKPLEPMATGGTAKRGAKKGRGAPAAPEISLCLIARDEEARIAACIESVKPFVDEMILVDTGSSDRTPHIARDLGARVYSLPWPDSFAAARNASLELATGRWIFWMDADDVISEECGQRLRELVALHPERDAAFQVRVRIPAGAGEHGETVVDHIKLFPNRPDLRFSFRIHEQVLPAIRKAGLPVLPGGLHVEHRHYDRSPEGQLKKRLRDFRLLELDLRENPEHPFVLFNLGMTYLYATREFEAAAQCLERSLRGSHPKDSIVRRAFALLGTAWMCRTAFDTSAWEKALLANETGRTHYPDDPELLYQAGVIYQEVGRFDEARAALEMLVHGSGEKDASLPEVDRGLRSPKGEYELARLYLRMGDAPHAARAMGSILERHPGFTPAREDLDQLSGKAWEV